MCRATWRRIGEVVIRGDNVMDGYFREPEATAAVMTGAWFHTGDMAVWDDEGYIHIVDRKKDIIISGGENISSIEVENAIAAHPGVLEAAVVGAPDPTWGEIPVAFVVLKPGAGSARKKNCADFAAAAPGEIQDCRASFEFLTSRCPKAARAKF